ncbi:MAG: cytidine/deoxycytidylate deaminase family protein [bacterium]|nr:cytidine/deoxycytidylate deaminase family protein [bacterium]
MRKKIKKDKCQHIRPDWDEYFINISREVGKRATCDRGRSGAVIVKDKRILCTGYVGAPVGLEHCDEIGHLYKTVYRADGTKSEHCVRTTHAEMNAIVQAARYGISIDGATIYCRMVPCLDCAKAIINAGIKRVVCEKLYHAGQDSVDFFTSAGVELKILSEETETYPRM